MFAVQGEFLFGFVFQPLDVGLVLVVNRAENPAVMAVVIHRYEIGGVP